jgi:hypothetical protein
MNKKILTLLVAPIISANAFAFEGTFKGINRDGKTCEATLIENKYVADSEVLPQIQLKIAGTIFKNGYTASFSDYAGRLQELQTDISAGKPLSTGGEWFDMQGNRGGYSFVASFSYPSGILKEIRVITDDNKNGRQNQQCNF